MLLVQIFNFRILGVINGVWSPKGHLSNIP